ncbi:MAG: hypothetical protein WA061_01970 [Microgenomates group bacterium]
MIEHTEKEIKEKVVKIWGDMNIEILKSESGKVVIKIEQMYEYVSCTFSQLEELSIFFDTKNIDWENGYCQGGCETCDFGSSYEIEIEVW